VRPNIAFPATVKGAAGLNDFFFGFVHCRRHCRRLRFSAFYHKRQSGKRGPGLNKVTPGESGIKTLSQFLIFFIARSFK
jgi:hypothetical protein